jgi:CheY-like chemotaxis protein
MDSAETLSRLLAQRADLPVLLISGMPQTEAMSGFVAKGLDPKHFLPKPFSAADLEGAVAGILGK